MLINLNTYDKIMFIPEQVIVNIHIGTNGINNGKLFLLCYSNISVIDLNNIQIDNNRQLSSKSYKSNILKSNENKGMSYIFGNLMISNDEELLLIVLNIDYKDVNIVYKYNISKIINTFSKENYRWKCLVEKKLLKNDYKCFENSKLNLLNIDIILNILSKI